MLQVKIYNTSGTELQTITDVIGATCNMRLSRVGDFRIELPADSTTLTNAQPGNEIALLDDATPIFRGIIGEVSPDSNKIERGRRIVIEGQEQTARLERDDVGQLAIYKLGWRKPARLEITLDTYAGTGYNAGEQMTEALDDDPNTFSSFEWDDNPGGDQTTFLYIGDWVPFYRADFDFWPTGNDAELLENAQNAGLYQYSGPVSESTGERFWESLDNVSDGTKSGDDAFQVDGEITYDDPTARWEKINHNERNYFWLRISYHRASATNRTTNIADLEIYTRVPDTTGINDIFGQFSEFALASGSDTVTADEIYHQFEGDNGLQALTILAELTGGVWRWDAPGQIKWMNDPTSGSITSTVKGADTAANGEPVALDYQLTKHATEATRIQVLGSGTGAGAINLDLADTSLLPSGWSIDTASSTIINGTAEAALGYSIAKSVTFKYVNSHLSPANSPEASNQLLIAGIKALEQMSKTDLETHRVIVMNPDIVKVGDRVTLNINDVAGLTAVNSTFVLTEVSYQLAQDGILTANMELVNATQAPLKGNDLLSKALSVGKYTATYRQVGSASDIDGASGSSGGGSGSGGSAPTDHTTLTNVLPNQHHNQLHNLNDTAHHGGLLDWSQINFTGSNHANIGNQTANDHHNQQHDIDGTDHTGTLSWAKVNKTGSDLADLETRSHASLQGVTADQHHSQQHELTGSDHQTTVSGNNTGDAYMLGTPASGDAARWYQSTGDASISANYDKLLHAVDGLLKLRDVELTRNLITAFVKSDLIPESTDTYNIGSPTALWRTGWLSELSAILFKKYEITVSGGTQMWTKSAGTLDGDLTTSTTSLPTSDLYAETGDILLMRGTNAAGLPQAEYMRVSNGLLSDETGNLSVQHAAFEQESTGVNTVNSNINLIHVNGTSYLAAYHISGPIPFSATEHDFIDFRFSFDASSISGRTRVRIWIGDETIKTTSNPFPGTAYDLRDRAKIPFFVDWVIDGSEAIPGDTFTTPNLADLINAWADSQDPDSNPPSNDNGIILYFEYMEGSNLGFYTHQQAGSSNDPASFRCVYRGTATNSITVERGLGQHTGRAWPEGGVIVNLGQGASAHNPEGDSLVEIDAMTGISPRLSMFKMSTPASGFIPVPREVLRIGNIRGVPADIPINDNRIGLWIGDQDNYILYDAERDKLIIDGQFLMQGDSEFRGDVKIATSGRIIQGTGTEGLDFDGVIIDNSGGIGRIRTLSNDSTDVTIDENGITLEANSTEDATSPRAIKFSGNNLAAGIYGYESGSANALGLVSANGNYDGAVKIEYDNTNRATVYLRARDITDALNPEFSELTLKNSSIVIQVGDVGRDWQFKSTGKIDGHYTAWQTATLGSAYSIAGWTIDTNRPMRYRLSADGMALHIAGRIFGGASYPGASDTLFTLNSAYRPSVQVSSPISTSSYSATLIVETSGQVRIISGGSVAIPSSFYLDCVIPI